MAHTPLLLRASRLRSPMWLLLPAGVIANLVFSTAATAAPRFSVPRPQAIASENTAKPAPSQGQAKRVKFKKDTKVDFEDELIEGGVKNPFSSMINSREGENKSGFVRIRKEWHDQMIMSVNGLSQ